MNPFEQRLSQRRGELKWPYMELNRDEAVFNYFVQMPERCWRERKRALRGQGSKREAAPGWRRTEGRELVCLFNFSGEFVRAGEDREGAYTELMYGAHYDHIRSVELWPKGFAWLLRDIPKEEDAQ